MDGTNTLINNVLNQFLCFTDFTVHPLNEKEEEYERSLELEDILIFTTGARDIPQWGLNRG